MKRRTLVISLLTVVSLIAVAIALKLRLDAKSNHRLNVLIVSACSLRMDRLGVFNPDIKLTPKIDAWAKGSFQFTNGIAERPWQNYTFESMDVVPPDYLVKLGYRDFTSRHGAYEFYIPPVEKKDKNLWYWSETDVLNYATGLAKMKQLLSKDEPTPFYIFAHLKYMHYPYLDTVNMNDADWKKLSPKSQELLAKYRSHPEKFDVQLPLIELITNSFSLAKKKMGVKEDVYSVAGLVSDRARNLRWRNSPGFKDDIELVKELYDLKLRRFDDFSSDLLNLYGDKDLQNRTVVIFAGDHGEAFSEHGVIGHSVNVYDEMLRYPMIVKFPGMDHTQVVDTQITLRQTALLARKIVEGEITAENFVEKLRTLTNDYVLSRNCPDTIRSVRYRSEWKLIKNADSDQRELYDLKTDPGETKNIAAENPEMAWKLEEYMVDHQADYERITARSTAAGVCTAN